MTGAPEPTPGAPTRGRLGYVDWLRGFAVLWMMQTHAYDSWLTPVGVLALAFPERTRRTWHAAVLTAAIALLTPLAWDLAWPSWIPFWLSGYWSGRAFGAFFPLFPWAGFTAAGAAAGLLLARGRERHREGCVIAGLALGGAAAIPVALLLDRLPVSVYPRYDFWWTSPNYFLIKLGILLLVLAFAYAWNAAPWAARASPVRQLGRTSLLVYWVHIEIVYGGIVARGLRGALDVPEASVALLVLTMLMLVLSLARTR